MISFFRKTILGALVIASFVTTGAQAQSTQDLQATLDAKDPSNPSLTLKNVSNAACQVAETALGTIAISEVRQDGKIIQPHYMETSFDESLAIILQEKLRTLQPGESAVISLRSFAVGSGYSLESISWSPEGGAYGLRYPLDTNKPLDMSLSYSVPIEAQGSPLCSAATTTSSQPSAFPMWLWYAVGIAAILILVLIFWLVRKKLLSKKHAVAGIFVIFGSFALQWQSPIAHARVDVHRDLAGQWADCIATLEANRDITGPVLDIINDPDTLVEIVPDDQNDTVQYSDDHYRIYWDTRENTAYIGGGTTVPRTPCDGLYHEMYHVLDYEKGTFSRDNCRRSGIETKEVMATRAQNILRERLGLAPRTHYDNKPLPEGNCNDNRSEEDRCAGGSCGETNGDPHLITFDGLRYSFQAAGEFTLARDTGGDFEVQIRQQPWPNSRRVAVTTAAAMRLGNDTVEFRQNNGQLDLLVNGEKRTLVTTNLSSGVIQPGHWSASVQWPDKTKVTVQKLGSFGLRIVVDPSETRRDKLEGLLGNLDGESENDLQIRGSDATIEPEFSQLYPRFADSWRLKPDGSLFTYENGQSTATFTDSSFPDEVAEPDNTPGRAAAEQFCRRFGIQDAVSLRNCIIDIGATARPEFALAALENQRLYLAKQGSQIIRLSVPTPGSTASYSFEVEEGQRVFVDATTNVPDHCSPLQLQDPTGKIIDVQCIANGRGVISSEIVSAAGMYSLRLAPTGDRVGSLSAQITLSRDIEQTVAIDGKSTTIDLASPGQVAHFMFKGRQQQKIQLDITTTLPDQCGGITLRKSDGQRIDSTCLSDGRSTFNTTLPADDTYKLTIDPTQSATGNITLRVIPD